ncbi:MAG: GNAT family N-acetyltransferase [Clostridia bacterium]|nr:GNAT family N-acetyltransferase [Clostridia bacterium]
MLRLIEPCESYLASYVEAFDAYEDFPRRAGNPFCDPRSGDLLTRFDDFRHARNLPDGWVGSSTWWLVDDEQQRFLGQIDVRHELTESLLRYGGHIGYAIRLGEWNKGYGTLMLSQTLPYAKALGITRCLITCDDDNPGSARVMEKNGFVLGDKVPNVIDGHAIITRRYWKEL